MPSSHAARSYSFTAAMFIATCVILRTLLRNHLLPVLRITSPRERLHHISLILSVVLTATMTIWSFSHIVSANAQPRDHDRVVENGVQITELQSANARTAISQAAMLVELAALKEKQSKQAEDIARYQGGLNTLVTCFGLLLVGLQILQILSIRKKAQ